ncbi:MAG: aspartate carbamoyltransferase [Ostreibacterium sp.]
MCLQGQHVLSVEQFSLKQIDTLFKTAEKLEAVAKGKVTTKLLNGAILANIFFEASTRTRMSFHSAFARLGGDICDTTGFSFSSISKGESLTDTASVISQYADVIVMRHPEQGAVADFAAQATIPVINGGDGPGEHPTQALLDLYTIKREFQKNGKTINGSTIAMTGDLKNGRTVHSLAKLLALFSNVTFHFISPNALPMPPYIIEKLQNAGHTVNIFTHPDKGIQHAAVIYCTRIQQERLSDGDLSQQNDLFSINKSLITTHAQSNAIILHPLPRDSREGAFDLSTDLDDDARLKIFTQAANGIPVRMALFVHCLGLADKVGNDFQPSIWAKIKQ